MGWWRMGGGGVTARGPSLIVSGSLSGGLCPRTEPSTHHYWGNTQPTIPYWFGNQRGRAGWAADTRSDTGNGSRLYELNLCHGGCGAMAGGRSRGARSWCCRPWRRGRSAFASLGRGQAKQSSADGWLLGTAPLRMRRIDSLSRNAATANGALTS